MKTKTAVVEIMIPLAYFDEKYTYQDVPLHSLDDRMVYIKKGGSGRKSISTKNVKLLRVFDTDDKKGIEGYLSELRGKSVNEHITIKKIIKGYLGELLRENIDETPKKGKLFIPRGIDEREIELKKHLKKILSSEEFQNDLEERIREWWPEVSDFDEWLEENGWDKEYLFYDEPLGVEISYYLQIEELTDFAYDLIDFDRYINFGDLALTKLRKMKYL